MLILIQIDVVLAENETGHPQQNDTSLNETSECGNGICEFNETVNCIEDCNRCSLDEDCEDNNLCTTDVCEGSPKECISIPVICNDNNPCTTDSCKNGECEYKQITLCGNEDDCCPSGCVYETDSDCKPEPEKDQCSRSSECNDNNPCTEDLCEGNPKKCNNNQQDGCTMGDQCFSYGTRNNINNVDSYCNIDNSWKQQKVKDALCSDDYECVSNKCSKGICIEPAREPSIVEKIFNLIATIIGLFFGIFK